MGSNGLPSLCRSAIFIAANKMKQKSRIPQKPLATGQIWRMDDSHLHVDLVGKHLVHYRLIKDEAKRTPLSLSNKRNIEKFLKDKKAVLLQQ